MRKIAAIINLIILYNVVNINKSVAQEIKKDTTNSKKYKNAVYGNIGFGIVEGLYINSTGYYERIVIQKNTISHFTKVGLGAYALWGYGGYFVLGQYGILSGKGKHKLELCAGANVFLAGDLKGTIPISGSIGYRVHKTKNRFMLRTGVGWPEAFYFGLGARF